MQCPDCSYISFNQEKNCGGCGSYFKKAANSPASLFRNNSFTIFSSPKASKEKSLGTSTPQVGEGIAVINTPESSQEDQELKSGEFLLDLSTTKKEEPGTNLKSVPSEPDTGGFVPLEFGIDTDITLEEMEIQGLRLGLELLEEEPPTPATSKTEPEETLFETSEEPEVGYLDLSPESLDHLELKINGLEIGSLKEPAVSKSNCEDITLNIDDLDDFSSIKSLALEEANKEFELASPPSQSPEQDTIEPAAPPLDLGNTEIILDLDEDPEPESPGPSSPPAQSDELEIKLEIDDSDWPLTINDEIPEVEIEDLGLELEDPTLKNSNSQKSPFLNR
jgi:hypothetical protein